MGSWTVWASGHVDERETMAPVHDRMPVILHPRDWDRWMHGTLQDALMLQQPYGGEMVVETNVG